MTGLTRYEAARSALAEARSVDEVKDIRDRAEAMRAYARMANDRQMEVDAAELRIRAERRLGQMLRATKDRGELHPGGRPRRDPLSGRRFNRIILREAGIDKKLSSRAQKFASPSEGEFDRQISDWRSRSLTAFGRVTVGLPHDPVIAAPKRIIREASPTIVSHRDARCWTVAELRRIAPLLLAMANHLGGADPLETVGGCISDTAIAALVEGGS